MAPEAIQTFGGGDIRHENLRTGALGSFAKRDGPSSKPSHWIGMVRGPRGAIRVGDLRER